LFKKQAIPFELKNKTKQNKNKNKQKPTASGKEVRKIIDCFFNSTS